MIEFKRMEIGMFVNKKSAMTLSEVLMALVILGVIISVALPGFLNNARPNDIKLKFKKSYFDTERVVSELINDTTLYPDSITDPSDLSSETNVNVGGRTYGGKNKFCNLFALKLNVIGTIRCKLDDELKEGEPEGEENDNDSLDNGKASFETSNGVLWVIPNNPTRNGQVEILVDVNGNKLPNTFEGDKRDRFIIPVSSDGRINVTGELEKSFLRSSNIN